MAAEDVPSGGEQRLQYSNKLELLLSLIGYAVGLGNIWRFPYLAYSYGGGAFLIPYALSLLLLGIPLFVLELGLGQMFRQGTLGVWVKLGLNRLRGVGAAATVCTFFVSLYYNVILAWTIYYLGRTIGSSLTGILPWEDQVSGFSCRESILFPSTALGNSTVVDPSTGLFNGAYKADFWCPSKGIPDFRTATPEGYSRLVVRPSTCPAAAALQFWETEALQQSSGLDDLGGFHPGMVVAYTLAWFLVWLCVSKGIASSGKVVYVTATVPYVALLAFFFRAVTLPNAGTGATFFIKPDFSLLLDGQVWVRAVTQIFYSLGVGFGCLIAFASYGPKDSDFVRDAVKVSLVNCGTSVFAGFVVFPILGFLAQELSEVNPCISGSDLKSLSSVGLSGTGLAFIAFPIAIAKMPGGFFWAILFFTMLLCLGIDSQFASVESIITVLHDAGLDTFLQKRFGWKPSKPMFAFAFCLLSYICGLVFVTRGGIYWFELFDNYVCVATMFFVAVMECFGLMWYDCGAWSAFKSRVLEWTGRDLGRFFLVSWKFACPVLLSLLVALSFLKIDLMAAHKSERFPEGAGYFPIWSIPLGWAIGLLPIITFCIMSFIPQGEANANEADAERPASNPPSTRAATSAAGTPAEGSAQQP